MENVFVLLIAIVCSILNIILFFKIWGMTNNVSKIKEKYVDAMPTRININKKYYYIKAIKGQEEATNYLKEYLIDYFEEALKDQFDQKKIEQVQKEIQSRFSFILEDSKINLNFDCIIEYLDKRDADVLNGLVTGGNVTYRCDDGTIYKGVLLSINIENKTGRIKVEDGSEFNTPLSKCEPA